jgi:cytochrome bd-type quinol oxidase subunit 1
VSGGNVIFTLIGFVGLYFVLGVLFLYLVGREIGHGPDKVVTIQNRSGQISTKQTLEDQEALVAEL